MSHEVVNDGVPAGNAHCVHLEEGRIQQELEGFPPPRLPCVLVAGEAGQDLRTRPETGQVVRATNRTTWCSYSNM